MSEPMLCRCCAKPIRKYTTTAYIKETKSQYDVERSYQRYIYLTNDTWPKTISDCRKLSNQHVLAVKRGKSGEIASFSEWDDVRYVDTLFCSGTCAQDFGRMAARHGTLQTQAYADAVKARQYAEVIKANHSRQETKDGHGTAV